MHTQIHLRSVQVGVCEVCVDQDGSLCLCPCKLAAHDLGVAQVGSLQQHPAEHLARQVLVAEITSCACRCVGEEQGKAGQDRTKQSRAEQGKSGKE